MPEIHNLPIKVTPGRARPELFASGSVLTIGAFDGLHLGHQKIIERLKAKAKDLELPAAVMSFRPDPAQYFSAHNCTALMSWRERMLALRQMGVDAVLCMPFNARVSQMSAKAFVDELVLQLGVRYLLIGDDFQFGSGREGNYELLKELGAGHGFEVEQSETHLLDGGRISSTRIRSALASGNLPEAEKLLGRPYEICGKVIRGKRLGTELGFPTANIALRRQRPAMNGVYAVTAILPNSERKQAVANLGIRPAVNSLESPLLEVHILDWNKDIYGQKLRVEFNSRLRDEMKFDSLAALKVAIQNDIARARDYFSKQPARA